jgi:hypothetical protein
MTPEQPERDLDKEFEDLIARWDVTAPFDDSYGDGRADEPGPDSTAPPAGPDRREPSAPPVRDPGPATPPPGVNIWRGPTVWLPPEGPGSGAAPAPEEDEEQDEFQPEPVVLPPQEDLHFWAIVVGLVGGGLLLLYVALTGVSTSSWWFLGAVALFVGGFALLILRQPRERDTTDDGTRL